MSVDGTDSTPVSDAAPVTAAPEVAADGAASSQPEFQRTPAPVSGASNYYGDADLPGESTVAPPRQRDERGRFAPRGDVKPNESATPPAPGPVVADTTINQPPSAPAADWFNQDLKAQSSYYGFSEAEARGFESPERLQAAMAALDRRMLRDFGSPQQSFQGQPAGNAPVGAPQGQPAPGQPSGSFDLAKYKDVLDEQSLGVLKELHTHHEAEFQRRDALIEQLNGTVQSLQEQAALAEGQRIEQTLDEQFEALGQDYEDLFGKGPIRELSAEVQAKRQEFYAYMRQLEEMDLRVGRPPATAKHNFQRVLRSMYGDRQTKAIRNQVAREVDARRSQQIARPTARTSAPLNPLEAAARRADELYKARGFDVTTRDDFDGVI